MIAFGLFKLGLQVELKILVRTENFGFEFAMSPIACATKVRWECYRLQYLFGKHTCSFLCMHCSFFIHDFKFKWLWKGYLVNVV